MSARSRSNSNLCLRFHGTEIKSPNHTDFNNLSCERVVAKPTGEGLSNCDLGEELCIYYYSYSWADPW